MHEIQQKLLQISAQIDISDLSLRQIGALVGEDHPQKIKHHLNQLELKGLIKTNLGGNVVPVRAGVADGIFVNIPIVGMANCGVPKSFADENIQGYITVSKSVVKGAAPDDLYVVKAIGDSLDQADINGRNVVDGDYLIVNAGVKQPDNGDYIVSIIGGFANVKKFTKKADQILLISESSGAYAPIAIDAEDFQDYMVAGKVVNVVKNE